MYKIISGIIFIFVLLLTVVACGSRAETGSPAVQLVQTIADTNFARMLGYVPYSFLEENDIWYTDPGTVKERYGLEALDNVEDISQIEGEMGPEFLEFLDEFGALPIAQSYTYRYQLKPLIGWNWFNIDRAVFNETPPPWGFSVVEGDFDEALIAEKLTGQGYAKSEYGSYTYYHINDDMQINLGNELGQKVMAQLNRVAVLDSKLVVTPATGIMTSVLDAMTGDLTRVIDIPACKAVADSLGEVQGAVLITADRLFQLDHTTPSFDLPAAASWGTLHNYSLFGTGYFDDGLERYWIISLYYDDKELAVSDSGELVSRLESYVFNTHLAQAENVSLTSKFEVGEPVVKEYSEGATLTMRCRYLPETTRSMSLFTLVVPGRDLLFLATEPATYLAETLTIHR